MKTIAIIDDDIHIGDMLREVLVQEGYSVLRAYSGTEALYWSVRKRAKVFRVIFLKSRTEPRF